MKPLAEVCELIKTGKTPPSKVTEYFEGDVNWFTPGDFKGNKYLLSSERKISQKAIADKKAFFFPKDSVLLNCIGDIGKVGVIAEKAASNQQITCLKPKPFLNVDYLYYWILKNKALLENLGNNAVVPILNNRQLGTAKIPLPPLATQKKIAEILDAADAHRQKTKQLLTKYDELAQSIFLEMFGDPVTNPKGWEVVKFSEVGKLDRGKSKHRPRNAPELLGGIHPLIQTGDVANSGGYIKEYNSTYSDLGLQQSKMWPKGTLCITIAANIAKTGILKFDACFPDSVVGFIPNKKTTNEYVQGWMKFLQKIIEDSAPESAQKNINLKILRDLDFMLPKIELQKKYTDTVNSIEDQKDIILSESENSENLFNSLLQKAFKGELNV